MARFGVWFAVSGVAFGLSGGPCVAGDKVELAKICAANTAAVDSIHTLHCKVRIDDPANRFGLSGGEYWRSGKSERLQFDHRGDFNWCVVRDGVVHYQVRQDVSHTPNIASHPEVKKGLDSGRWHWHGAVERHTGAAPFAFAPWASALCAMGDGGKNGNVTFEEFARNHSNELESVSKAPNGDVVVQFRLPGYVCIQHFDRMANYMMRKAESRSDSPGGYTSSAEVTSYNEGAPGVFFPERVVVKRSTGGKEEADQVFTFTNITINKPLPEQTFDLKFRPGITLTDRIEGVKYTVDRDGRSVGEKTPMSVVSTPPLSPEDAGNPIETREEPARTGWWILPLSIGVVLSAGVLWLLRRRQRADS